MKNTGLKMIVVLASLMVAWSSSVYADRDYKQAYRKDRGEHGHGYRKYSRDDDHYYRKHERDYDGGKYYRWDKHYRHEYRYPREGVIVRTLPSRHHRVHYHDHDYFYFGGIWYRPSGVSFVVVRPPIGITVPLLPAYYSTIWLNSRPYYYANDVYYVWRDDLDSYEVVAPPEGVNSSAAIQQSDELYIYPKQGQDEQKQADDRYACHRWGVEQTGYDPTRPTESRSSTDPAHDRNEYQRAMRACLEGRGYSVR